MVDNIKAAFGKRIDALDWMAPDTKAEAKKKVETMQSVSATPTHGSTIATLTIERERAPMPTRSRRKRRDYQHQLGKIGKPLDRERVVDERRRLVNAVNLPVQNALNFPAAILQPPFFDPKADAAFNYGAIGAVIGHEISHSFDNNGAAFEFERARCATGGPTPTRRTSNGAGKALATQFDTYEPFPGLHVKGELTLGENIADIAGLQPQPTMRTTPRSAARRRR